MKFKAETLVMREQDLVHGMSNQWFILHLALSVSASKGSFKATLEWNFKTPGKEHLCVNQSQKLLPHPGEESLSDQKPSSFAVVWRQGNCGVTLKMNMKPWGSASDNVLFCVKALHSRETLLVWSRLEPRLGCPGKNYSCCRILSAMVSRGWDLGELFC